jgi:hypothetical protein
MYNTYASIIGFSIRKGHSKLQVDKTLSNKYIVCSNEDHYENESSWKDGMFSLMSIEEGI